MKQLKVLGTVAIFALLGLNMQIIGVARAEPVLAQRFSTILSNDACKGLDQVDSTQGCNSKGSAVNGLIGVAVNTISFIVGAVAVLMVIISGFRYITSGGDAAKVTGAKNALVYALVGVAVVALAQFLVHFALSSAVSSQTCPPGKNLSANGKCS